MFVEIIFFLLVGFILGLTLVGLKFTTGLDEISVRLLYGICIFPIVAIVLGFVDLISWFWFVVVCLVVVLRFWNVIKGLSFSFDYDSILVCIMALVMFVAFSHGAFSHVWLEDGDPNGFAQAVSYMVHYGTFLKPSDMFVTRYMEPYPVGYQTVIAAVSSIGGNVNGVLKSVNSLMIALAVVAIYHLSMSVGFSRRYSLFVSFIIFAIPSFSTRFIFAQSLAMLQMIMGFYFLSRSRDQPSTFYSGLCFGALCITHQMTAVVAAVLAFLWLVADVLTNRKTTCGFLSVAVICILIAGPWWAFEYGKYGVDKIVNQLNLEALSKSGLGLSDPTLRLYALTDLINVPLENSIDNMTGFGPVIFLLLICSFYVFLVAKDKTFYVNLSLLWFVFLFVALFSNHLPVSFIPSRIWPYVSIPVAFLSAYVIYMCQKSQRDIMRAFAVILVLGVVATSALPKFEFNGRMWGSSRFTTMDEYKMAVFLSGLPIGTKVMDACFYERVWGLNLWDDPLDEYALWMKNTDVLNASFRSNYGWDSEGWIKLDGKNKSLIYSEDPVSLGAVLSGNYEYIIIGSKCMKMWNVDGIELNMRVSELVNSDRFQTVFKSNDEYVLGVN